MTRPGNIAAEIAKLNRIRRAHPALQTHLGLKFYPAHDDRVLLYGKRLPNQVEMILIAVNLDPFHAHDVTIEVPVVGMATARSRDDEGQRPDARHGVHLAWQIATVTAGSGRASLRNLAHHARSGGLIWKPR